MNFCKCGRIINEGDEYRELSNGSLKCAECEYRREKGIFLHNGYFMFWVT